MRNASFAIGLALGAFSGLFGIQASARQLIPPSGYDDGSRSPAPDVAFPMEPGAPALTRISDKTLADRFCIIPTYPYAAAAHVKIVGAFAVAERAGFKPYTAWASGFLPVTLAFSDGRCFSFSANYNYGTLSNGRLNRVDCTRSKYASDDRPPLFSPPHTLRLIDSHWGYSAWADDRAGSTIVAVPFVTTFQPFFAAKMKVIEMLAMNGPDWPGGNVTLIGRVDGRLTIVVLDVGY